MFDFLTISFGTAAVAYALLGAMLLFGRSAVWPHKHVAFVAILMVIWSALMLLAARSGPSFAALIFFDTPHTVGLLWILGEMIRRGSQPGALRTFGLILRYVGFVQGAVLLLMAQLGSVSSAAVATYAMIGTTVLGLLAIEQIVRAAVPARNASALLICAAFGVVLVFDFFVYTQGVVFGAINEQIWEARGLVNALAVPVIIVALRKDSNWETSVFVSRQVVFYTASLVGVGIYLVAVSFGGTVIRRYGGGWADGLEAAFMAASFLALFLVLLSRRMRRRLRVFLAKHFYRNRYDYREEWLKLIGRLAQESSQVPMPEQCLYALGDILDSGSGAIWLRDPRGLRYERACEFGGFDAPASLAPDLPLVSFMQRTGWIVDGQEYSANAAAYSESLRRDENDHLVDDRVFVPITLGEDMIGLVALSRPDGLDPLNFEDHDLLRTVGRQLAVFLEQVRGSQMLEERSQFEVFNRLTAYVMHDLKNLIAQLSMVVSNAAVHKQNPAFLDDAIDTIDNAVGRMYRLLGQLEGDSLSGRVALVSVADMLQHVGNVAASRKPAPSIHVAPDAPDVFADKERFESVLSHLVRNAQDATPVSGSVRVDAARGEEADALDQLRITITDTGKGMTAEFVRDRLFKPFFSTKGAQGMGIGAYQAREYIEEIGGTLEVDSSLGNGSTVTIILPAAVGKEPTDKTNIEEPECAST